MFKKILRIFLIVVMPLFFLFIIEYFNFKSTLLIVENFKINTMRWILEYAILFLITTSFWILNKYIFLIAGYSFIAITVIISMVSSMKHEIRGEPLYPWDFILFNETIGILGSDKSLISTSHLTLLILLLLGILFYFYSIFRFYDKLKNNFIKKISYISIVILIVLSLLLVLDFKENDIEEPLNTYSDTGIVYGIFQNFKYYYNMNSKYGEYSESRIDSITSSIQKVNLPSENTVKPNVVVVMSEAFWDTSNLKNIEINQDAIPFFRELSQEATSGQLLVPVYGGATANTEFEVLTGLSTKFLVPGIIPYTTYIDKPMESLASIYRNQGYVSTAIHSYHNWFYDRNTVYKQLGFNKFISMEFFGDSKQIGAFLDDRELFEILLAELKESEQPNFIYAVTMLNHGGYPEDRFNEYNFNVEGNISDKAKSILRTYVETQKVVDDGLEYLISEIEQLDEPTIVVFFGDHLPMLGEDYQVYKETNYYSGKSNDFSEFYKMHTVPYLIWDNYKENENEKMDMSSNFLGSYLLEYTGLEGNNIFNYNSMLLHEGIKNLPEKKFYKEVGIDTQREQELINNYDLLQFDSIFGNNYSYSNDDIVFNDYLLGKDKIYINGTFPAEINKNEPFNEYEGNSIVGVIGDNFVEVSSYLGGGSEIYINNQKQSTVFLDENYISCIVPKEFYSSSGEIEIQVKITDSKGKVLSESNIFKVKVN